MQFAADGFLGGELVVGVAFLGNELFADGLGREPGVEPLGSEGRIGLALGVHQGADVGQEVGQVLLAALTTAAGEGIQTDDA